MVVRSQMSSEPATSEDDTVLTKQQLDLVNTAVSVSHHGATMHGPNKMIQKVTDFEVRRSRRKREREHARAVVKGSFGAGTMSQSRSLLDKEAQILKLVGIRENYLERYVHTSHHHRGQIALCSNGSGLLGGTGACGLGLL